MDAENTENIEKIEMVWNKLGTGRKMNHQDYLFACALLDPDTNPMLRKEPDGWITKNVLLRSRQTAIYLRDVPGDAEALSVIRTQMHRDKPVYEVFPFYFGPLGAMISEEVPPCPKPD